MDRGGVHGWVDCGDTDGGGMSEKPEALRLADRLDLWGDQGDLLEAAAELRRQYGEIIELKAKVDVAESGYHAAVQKAQWQASTNSELNRHMKQKHELRAECDALRAELKEQSKAADMIAEVRDACAKSTLAWQNAGIDLGQQLKKAEAERDALRSDLATLRDQNYETQSLLKGAEAECDALRAELLSIGDLDKRHAIARESGLAEWADWAQNRARHAALKEPTNG